VAFPSISTGVYGYPVDRAAPVAINAVRDALRCQAHPSIVRFVLFDEHTLDAYVKAAQQILVG
jgi:O-acetyl-ADP-ribose deacetylase (regulator of RNase III)